MRLPPWGAALLSVVIGLTAALVAGEVALRFLPVKHDIDAAAVNAESPVFRFLPDRDFLWSRDWDLIMVNRGRINNAGFVNDQDYDPAAPGPFLAVLGESYIEAVMLPCAETVQRHLSPAARSKGRVYSFGASGTPLIQYLAWGDHARHVYRPQGMVFIVVGNDFEESLVKYKVSPGNHLYVSGEGSEFQLHRSDYQPLGCSGCCSSPV